MVLYIIINLGDSLNINPMIFYKSLKTDCLYLSHAERPFKVKEIVIDNDNTIFLNEE